MCTRAKRIEAVYFRQKEDVYLDIFLLWVTSPCWLSHRDAVSKTKQGNFTL